MAAMLYGTAAVRTRRCHCRHSVQRAPHAHSRYSLQRGQPQVPLPPAPPAPRGSGSAHSQILSPRCCPPFLHGASTLRLRSAAITTGGAARPPHRACAAPRAPFPPLAPPRAHERRSAPWRPGLPRRPVVPRAPHTKDALGNGGGRGLAKRPRENGAAPGSGRGHSGGSASAQRGGRRGGAAP